MFRKYFFVCIPDPPGGMCPTDHTAHRRRICLALCEPVRQECDTAIDAEDSELWTSPFRQTLGKSHSLDGGLHIASLHRGRIKFGREMIMVCVGPPPPPRPPLVMYAVLATRVCQRRSISWPLPHTLPLDRLFGVSVVVAIATVSARTCCRTLAGILCGEKSLSRFLPSGG